MCGICYVRRSDGKSAARMIVKRYNAQKARGTEGFGFVAIRGNEILKYARRTTEKDILALLESPELRDADEIMFHHRTPTSTPNFKDAAHPIRVRNASLKYDYYVIHNGIIFDDDTLKAKHEALGFKYTTEVTNEWTGKSGVISRLTKYNDSEALAIELAMDIDKGPGTGVSLTGSIAFVCIQAEKNSKNAVKLFFGRNSANPLKFDHQKTYLTVTSEGNGELVEINMLHSIDYATGALEKVDYKVGTSYAYHYEGAPYHRSQGFRHDSAEAPWNRRASEPIAGGKITSEEIDKAVNRAMGFDTTRGDYPDDYDDVPALPAPSRIEVADAAQDEIEDIEEYIDLCAEYKDIQEQLAKIVDKNTTEAQYLEDRRLDLEDEISWFETKHSAKLIK